MKRSFEDIMSNLKTTIAGFDFYTDFNKVFVNIEEISISLNLMNSLLNTGDDFDKRFISLIHKYPDVLKSIPILLAVRENKLPVLEKGNVEEYRFDKLSNEDESYLRFMDKTGLKELISKGKVKNLVDYVTGVEVGLDSNARKNRTGTAMETLVESYLRSIPNLEVIRQASTKTIKEKFHFDGLDNIKLSDGSYSKKAEKRFDFACRYDDVIYLIETNFYGSGGSKLNETARSYQEIAEQLKNIPSCHFVWITDGIGWNSAKGNLQESYLHQSNLLTIYDLEFDGIKKTIREYIKKK
jgi:type II restriction enzyme